MGEGMGRCNALLVCKHGALNVVHAQDTCRCRASTHAH
jgi:hypothetical protein